MTEPPRHPAVRKANEPRHAGASRGERGAAPIAVSRRAVSRPARLTSPPSGAPERPGRLQSVLGALPFGMLLIGLLVYFLGEYRQTAARPIAAESVLIAGRYDGLSRVGSSGAGRHYLWLLEASEAAGESRRRGVRVPPDAAAGLRDTLAIGEAIEVDAAPSVSGSTTRWLWRLRSGSTVVFDRSDTLR